MNILESIALALVWSIAPILVGKSYEHLLMRVQHVVTNISELLCHLCVYIHIGGYMLSLSAYCLIHEYPYTSQNLKQVTIAI